MEIQDFKLLNNPNSAMKANFRVYIPQWDFNICLTYFEKDDGSSWFGYPQQQWTTNDGQKKYKWLAYFGEKAKEKFEVGVRSKLKEHLPAKTEAQIDKMTKYDNEELPF